MKFTKISKGKLMPVLNLALSQEPSVLIIGLKLKKPLIISI